MRRLFLLAAVVPGLLAVFWLLKPSASVSVAPAPEPVRRVAQPAAVEVRELEALPPSVPGSWSRGQESVAEALEGVAIRCEVGSQLDGVRLTGGLSPQVREGWFSTVVSALHGTLAVAERGQPATFQVHWQALQVGDAVPCQVEWLDHAEVRIEVRDDLGAELPNAVVQGCGARGTTDARSRVALTVPLADLCRFTTVGTSAPHYGGFVDVEGLHAGEVREVILFAQSRRRGWRPPSAGGDGWEGVTSLDDQVAAVEALLPQASGQEEEVLESVRDDLRHRAALERVTDEQRELLDEMDALTKRFREGEPQALEDLSDLSDDLLENARHRIELLDEH